MEGPLLARTESRENFTERSRSSSQASTVPSVPQGPAWSRRQDPRFAGGSTTRATYRDVSGYTEEARQRPIVPQPNLKMEGEFSRELSSKEHFKPLPYSRRPASVRRQMIQTPTGKFN